MTCGRCHTCGNPLRTVLDGEEWCKTCGVYRRYRSHGFIAFAGGNSPCPLPLSYRPPIEKICGCGAKHTGYFTQCTRCAGRASDEQRSLSY